MLKKMKNTKNTQFRLGRFVLYFISLDVRKEKIKKRRKIESRFYLEESLNIFLYILGRNLTNIECTNTKKFFTNKIGPSIFWSIVIGFYYLI